MTEKTKKRTKTRLEKELKRASKFTSEEELGSVTSEIFKETTQKPAKSKGTPHERMPGRVVRGNKTPWTHDDLVKVFGVCEFTPDETMHWTTHGVVYQLFAGVSMAVPQCVKIEYDRRRRTIMEDTHSIPRDSGFETIEELGVGALPPE